MGMQQPLTRSAETPGQQAADLGLLGAAYRNRTDDPFITRELHTRKALNWLAPAASTKATQLGQNDRTEVVYVQNAPTRTLCGLLDACHKKAGGVMRTLGHWHTTVPLAVAAVGLRPPGYEQTRLHARSSFASHRHASSFDLG